MARQHAADELFRAVVTVVLPEVTRPDGTVVPSWTRTFTVGPYPKEHTARAQVTREVNSRRGYKVTGVVERAALTWEPVQ